jgi:hypothetical protein
MGYLRCGHAKSALFAEVASWYAGTVPESEKSRYLPRPRVRGAVSLRMIICPQCLGSFRTLYQEGKTERCPYCACHVVHRPRLVDVAPRMHGSATTLEETQRWLSECLSFLGAWCQEQESMDLRVLDALGRQLDMLTREIADCRRRLHNDRVQKGCRSHDE